MHSFQSPCDPQQSSRLLQLPAELRVKIIRLLCQSKEPVPGRQKRIRIASSASHNCNLSAQLLSCGQLLYSEASQVLYKENVARIICCYAAGDDEVLICGVIGQEQQVQVVRSAARSPAHGLFSETAATRFDRYYFEINLESLADIWSICYALQDLLWTKEVTIKLVPWSTSAVHPADFTKPCRMLGCNRVTFREERLQNQSSVTEATKKIIESDAFVEDLYPAWSDLHKRILSSMPNMEDDEDVDERFSSEYEDDLAGLAYAVYICDSEVFTHERDVLLARTREWIYKWEDYRKYIADRKREQAQSLMEEANDIEGEVSEEVKHSIGLHEEVVEHYEAEATEEEESRCEDDDEGAEEDASTKE